MARPSNIPKYRRHSSGQARCTINGRDYMLGPWQSKTSIREYDRLVAEYLASGRCPSFGVDQQGYTVAMLARDYIRHCRAEYLGTADNEVMRVRPVLRNLVDLYADTDAADFTPERLKAVRQVMIEKGLTRQGINQRIRTLKRVFAWAALSRKIPPDVSATLALLPALRIGRSKAPESDPVTPVADATVDATLSHLSPVVADMVRLQRLIGCRPAEVCNLTSASIDRSGDVWVATLSEHKNAHREQSRTLFIGPKAQAILEPYLGREDGGPLFSPSESAAWHRAKRHGRRRTPLTWGNRPGKSSKGLRGSKAKRSAGDRFTTDSYRRAIHRACDLAFPAPEPLAQRDGESDPARRKRLTDGQIAELNAWQSKHRWAPNQLRHSKGTEVRREFGLEAAQVTLGHSKADVTQVYAERDIALAKRVALATG